MRRRSQTLAGSEITFCADIDGKTTDHFSASAFDELLDCCQKVLALHAGKAGKIILVSLNLCGIRQNA